jgi:hypothetical protein
MPWSVRNHKGGGFDIVRTATGEVVGHSTTKRNAILSIWHRKKAEGMVGSDKHRSLRRKEKK